MRILKTIRSFTGSQCSSFRRKSLMLTRCPQTPNTSLTALFCTRWSLDIAELGKPKSRLLLASSLDVTNACTKRSAVGRSIYFRIRPILEIARLAARHTLFTCGMEVMCWSNMTPRLRTSEAMPTSQSPTLVEIGVGFLINREVKCSTSVFESFRSNFFSAVHVFTPLTQSSRRWSLPSLREPNTRYTVYHQHRS